MKIFRKKKKPVNKYKTRKMVHIIRDRHELPDSFGNKT